MLLHRTSGIRAASEMTFENRWCRYKELDKKVPQAYFNTLRTLFCRTTQYMRRIFSKEEVRNILIAEYDYDTDIAVQREEAGKIALAKGISQGAMQKALETVRNLLQFGLSVENIAQADVEALNHNYKL